MKLSGIRSDISARNGAFLLFVIVLSVVVRDGAVSAGRDMWISSIIALVIMIPIIAMFCRISYLCKDDDFFTFIEKIFGKVASKIIIILFSWYAIQVAAIIISNYSEYTHIIELDKTSMLVLVVTIAFVAAFLARSGLQVLGRWAVIIGIFVLIITTVTIVISIPVMDFSNLLPILDDGIGEAFSQGIVYSFGIYGEIVIFLAAATAIKSRKGRTRTFFWGILSGAIILTISVIKNIVVIGPLLMEESYYPSYTAARIIRVDGFFERVESLISLNFILMGITKLALCLTAAARGIAKIADSKDYRAYSWIVAVFAAALGYVQFAGIPEIMKFVKHYWAYALPFQIILPGIIWVAAEVKKMRGPIGQ